jgi:hypothetical protein
MAQDEADKLKLEADYAALLLTEQEDAEREKEEQQGFPLSERQELLWQL